MPSENTLNEPLVVDNECLRAALVEILPYVLPPELQATLSKKRIQRIVATLLIELPETQIHILRDGLQENKLLIVASKMVQEYADLITQVMSGKICMSSQASSLIKTQGLFKALAYMQREHASNNSQSQEEIDLASATRRGQLKALNRQMEYRRVHDSPEFISLMPRDEPFTNKDYMGMESAVNKSLKSREMFNIWNQTPASGTPRIQQTCSPEVMFRIMTALFTIGLKSEKNESIMSLAPVQGTLEETKVSGSDQDSEANLVKIHTHSKSFF